MIARASAVRINDVMPPKAQNHSTNPYHQSAYPPATAHSPGAYGMNPYSSTMPHYAQSPVQHIRHDGNAPSGSHPGQWNGNAAASGSVLPPRQVSAGPRLLAVAKEESEDDEEDDAFADTPESTVEVKKKTTRGSRACTVVSLSRLRIMIRRPCSY